jgi:hypothetical protein
MTNTLISNDYNDQENRIFQTGSKVGNGNVTFNFYYPHGTKETATIHLYGYDNPRMEKYPIANFIFPGFNLKNASPLVYGNQSLEISFKEGFSGNTWWFAWADTNEEQLIGKKIEIPIPTGCAQITGATGTLNCLGYEIVYPTKPLKVENYLSYSGNSNGTGTNGMFKIFSDVAGMPFGQSGTTGIYLSSTGDYELYISLQDNIEGFPQFAWKNINDNDLFDKYVVACATVSLFNLTTNRYSHTGYGLFAMDLGRRNFFCAQDLLVYPTGTNQLIIETNSNSQNLTMQQGRGIPYFNFSNGFLSSHYFYVMRVSNRDRNTPIRKIAFPQPVSSFFFYTQEPLQTVNVNSIEWQTYYVYRTGESRPLYRPIKHPLA